MVCYRPPRPGNQIARYAGNDAAGDIMSRTATAWTASPTVWGQRPWTPKRFRLCWFDHLVTEGEMAGEAQGYGQLIDSFATLEIAELFAKSAAAWFLHRYGPGDLVCVDAEHPDSPHLILTLACSGPPRESMFAGPMEDVTPGELVAANVTEE